VKEIVETSNDYIANPRFLEPMRSIEFIRSNGTVNDAS